MIPVSTDDSSRHGRDAAVASRTILALCALIFLWQLTWGPGRAGLGYALGFTPGVFFGHAAPLAQFGAFPPPTTLITHMFLHGGWLHLLGNLLYLWIFGANVEDAFGHPQFVVFYLLSGIAAALSQGLPDTAAMTPMIGASGAISGVLGAYLVLYPRTEVRVLLPVIFVVKLVSMPAYWVLAFWFVVQLLYEFAAPAAGGGIAFRAHIGGFIAGVVLTPLFARRHAIIA